MPRSDPNVSNRLTDIFALGSTVYFIMNGHEPFPELHASADEREIESRFRSQDFPVLDEALGGKIIRDCWAGNYKTAGEVVRDLHGVIGS
jgi:hypothetical protein